MRKAALHDEIYGPDPRDESSETVMTASKTPNTTAERAATAASGPTEKSLVDGSPYHTPTSVV